MNTKHGAVPYKLKPIQGICPSCYPGTVPETMAAEAENVDLDESSIIKRGGYGSAINHSSPIGGRALAIGAFYPASGNRSLVVAGVDTDAAPDVYKILVDTDQNGIVDNTTGLIASPPTTIPTVADIIQYRHDRLYVGDDANGLYRSDSLGAAALVANYVKPTTIWAEPQQFICQSFDGAFTAAGGLAQANDTTTKVEGTGSLKVTADVAGDRGGTVKAAWSYTGSAASYLDIAGHRFFSMRVYCNRAGPAFQVSLLFDAALTDVTAAAWGAMPVFRIATANTWQNVDLDLSYWSTGLLRRTFGIQIRYLEDGGGGYPVQFYFDAGRLVGFLSAGKYNYWATEARVETISGVNVTTKESGPSTPDDLTNAAESRSRWHQLAARVTGQTGPTHVYWYRYRLDGPFSRGYLLGSTRIYTLSTTLNGAITSSATSISINAKALTPSGNLDIGDYIQIGSELLRVSAAITGAGPYTVPVTRGEIGTEAASASNGASVVRVMTYQDKIDDGTLALDPDAVRAPLPAAKSDPPMAKTYCLWNHRMASGGPIIGGTAYPNRLYVSRYQWPEEFREMFTPADDPLGAGWIDIADKDPIVRLVEWAGRLMIFCSRSIYELTGSGWDDFDLTKRADFGLVARNAVVLDGSMLYLLASDGVRVMVPSVNIDDRFESWIISEPVDVLLREMPGAYISTCCAGKDERGRIVIGFPRPAQTYATAELLFDPRKRNALTRKHDEMRPGWTYYPGTVGWKPTCYANVRRGGGSGAVSDNGQIFAGSAVVLGGYWKHRNAADSAILNDNGSTIPWSLTTGRINAGLGQRLQAVYAELVADAAANETVTATPILDGVASTSPGTITFSAAVSGVVSPSARLAVANIARMMQLKLSGTHTVALKIREVVLGFNRRS